MTYPTILIVFSAILMGLLINFVLPQFADFYKSFEADMPGITRLIMRASIALNRIWYVPLVLIAGLAYAVVRLQRSPDFRHHLDRAKLRVPFGRTIWLESGVSLFSRDARPSPEAGISLLGAIEIAIQAVPNAWTAVHEGGPDFIRTARACPIPWPNAGTFPAWPWT